MFNLHRIVLSPSPFQRYPSEERMIGGAQYAKRRVGDGEWGREVSWSGLRNRSNGDFLQDNSFMKAL